jgi:hypothetical protein
MKMKKNKATPLPVDDMDNRWDAVVREMAKKGFYGSTIAQSTGLTISQVRYRTKKLLVSPLFYRKGEGIDAKLALKDIDMSLKKANFLHQKIADLTKKRKTKRYPFSALKTKILAGKLKKLENAIA